MSTRPRISSAPVLRRSALERRHRSEAPSKVALRRSRTGAGASSRPCARTRVAWGAPSHLRLKFADSTGQSTAVRPPTLNPMTGWGRLASILRFKKKPEASVELHQQVRWPVPKSIQSTTGVADGLEYQATRRSAGVTENRTINERN
jgi:hypothetical protein